MAQSSQRRYPVQRQTVYPYILMGLVALAYANSFQAPFVLDDVTVITGNPKLFNLWPPWRAVLQPSRPLADYSFALNAAVSGLHPADFRLFNILLHAATACLLYSLLRRVFRLHICGLAQQAEDGAFVAALLWALHPLQTQAVTYIAQRIEALMGFFVVLMFYTFVRARTSTHRRAWQSAAVASCLLAVSCKEVAVTAPVLLLLFDWLVLRSNPKRLWRRRAMYAGLLLSWVWLGILLILAHRLGPDNGIFREQAVDRWAYARTQIGVVVHYLRLVVWPRELVIDYQWPLAAGWHEVWQPALLLAGLATGLLYGICRRRPWAFCLLWFFIILLPSSSIVPLANAAFEHRLYLPLAGPATLLTTGWLRILQRRQTAPAQHQPNWLPAMSLSLPLLLALILGVLTVQRNRVYSSQESLWQDVIRKRPDNTRAYRGLALNLLKQQRFGEALEVSQQLLARLEPYGIAGLNTETIQAQAANGGLPLATYQQAHLLVGQAWMGLAHAEQAETHFEEVLRINPDNLSALNELAYLAHLQQDPARANALWQQALCLDPTNVPANLRSGMAALQAGRFAQAAEAFRNVLRHRPDSITAHARLAWLLATCPDATIRDGAEALRLAQSLQTLAGAPHPRVLDILAAAYAEQGNFTAAQTQMEHAISLWNTTKPHRRETTDNDEFRSSYEDLLERRETYRKNKPYREPVPADGKSPGA